jgi:glycosyltransferase involved in cell wall biosynthesis
MKLLAIGHDASLTGAPLLLESYLSTACKKNSFKQVRIILGSGGALTQNYLEIADTFVADQYIPIPLVSRIANKLAIKLGYDNSQKDPLRNWIERSEEPDIIYANTVASIPLLSRILPLLRCRPKIVIHVHELDWLLQKYETDHGIGAFLRTATAVIAPCSAVANALNSLLGVPLSLIQIIPEWVCRDVHVERYNLMGLQVREELGLKDSDILCIGVGKMQWRKGSDLLPLISSKCAKFCSNIYFAWIGSDSSDELMQLKLDARKAGVGQFIHLIPEQSDPYPYYSAADLYILPSREDPCPVAMLEAGLFGLPVICFDQSGGAVEYICNGAGVSAPYLDIDSFASWILKLSKDSDSRQLMGKQGMKLTSQLHNATECTNRISNLLLECHKVNP